MSLADHQGRLWAWAELRRRAAEDRAIKPPIVKFKRRNPAKIEIGPFAARVLRMRLKRQA